MIFSSSKSQNTVTGSLIFSDTTIFKLLFAFSLISLITLSPTPYFRFTLLGLLSAKAPSGIFTSIFSKFSILFGKSHMSHKAHPPEKK